MTNLLLDLNPFSDSYLNLRASSTNQLVISSQELRKASAEIDRLNLYNMQLEEQLASKSAQLEEAQAHVNRHDLALKVVEREMAEAQRAKGKADRKLGDAEALREQLQVRAMKKVDVVDFIRGLAASLNRWTRAEGCFVICAESLLPHAD